jgi:hypothetical protein
MVRQSTCVQDVFACYEHTDEVVVSADAGYLLSAVVS